MKLLRTTVAVAALCLSASASLAAGLSAQVNTGQVAQGDSFQLVLTAKQATAAPDLSPLSQNFDVLGTSQSSQTQIINGQRSQSVSWIVTLAPQSTGALTIPAIHAGALSSDPLQVQVLDASQMPKLQGTTGISLSATIDQGDHYQFQEIPLTVRIETAQPLQSAELIAPTGDFELTQTGQDRQSRITRNGQPITVIERDYLLRPDTTGGLTIPAFTLKGTVPDGAGRRSAVSSPFGGRDPFAMMDQMMARMGRPGGMTSPFGSMFQSGKPFVARSDALTLDVLANPNAGTSDWFLPAKAVELHEVWQPETPSFREGEAVTRKISVLALGARPEQLPNLSFADPDGARIYMDTVDTDMVETPEGTVARRDFSLSVVPTRGGQVTLPEIAVDWLDTASGETKVATLPAQTISVEGTVPAAATQSVAPRAVPTQSAQSYGPVSLGLSGLAFLAAFGTGLVLFRRRRRTSRPVDINSRRDKAHVLKTLRNAASASDQSAFYQGLLELRALSDPQERTQIDTALAQLDRAAYAPEQSHVSTDLRKLLKTLSVRRSSKGGLFRRTSTDTLPALYPRNVT
ncbi:BatD family protein [Sagittula stellata]|uniref:BatD family protein n=1 Tax=Sagittula stellata TaxID=52603 RepID=UPI0002E6BC2A|nr:BatD family protein [Sagittula stellata]